MSSPTTYTPNSTGNPCTQLTVAYSLTGDMTMFLPNGITLIPNSLIPGGTIFTAANSPGSPSNTQELIVSMANSGHGTVGSNINFSTIALPTTKPALVFSQRLIGLVTLIPGTTLPIGTVLTKDWYLTTTVSPIPPVTGVIYEGRTNFDLGNDAIPLTGDINYDCRCGSLTQPCKCVVTDYIPPILPTIPPITYIVSSAVNNSDITAALLAAIHTASTNPSIKGGTIFITYTGPPIVTPPSGGGIGGEGEFPNFYISPMTITSVANIEIKMDNFLTLSANLFNPCTGGTPIPINSNNTIIFITLCNNIMITGNGFDGIINGQGYSWANQTGTATASQRPRLFSFNRCSTVYINNLTCIESPSFMFAFAYTNNVTFQTVGIYTDSTFGNTDGIDPAGSHYLIENTIISCGDDNVSVKGANIFCSDIMIRNCTVGDGHGLGVGGQTDLTFGIDNVTIRDCKFTPNPINPMLYYTAENNGIRIKTFSTSTGYAQNITFENLKMYGVSVPIQFTLFYQLSNTINPSTIASINADNTNFIPTTSGAPPPYIQNVVVKNLKAYNAVYSNLITGIPTVPGIISNLVFKDVKVQPMIDSGFETDFFNTTAQFLGKVNFGPIVTYNSLIIEKEPENKCVCKHGNVHLTTTVIGTSGIANNTPSYQWQAKCINLINGPQSDGSVVIGATTSDLYIDNIRMRNLYSVTVSNDLDVYNPPITGSSTIIPGGGLITMNSALAAVNVKSCC